MNKLNDLYQTIIKENTKEIIKHSFYDYFPIFDTFPIDQKLILENIICQSEDPDYFVKLPKEFKTITLANNNRFIDESNLKVLLPQINIKLPKVFISIFDFNKSQEIQRFLQSISNISTDGIELGIKIILKNKSRRGQLIDLTTVGKDLVILLFNKAEFNDRTIYHQWTHYFQRFVRG